MFTYLSSIAAHLSFYVLIWSTDLFVVNRIAYNIIPLHSTYSFDNNIQLYIIFQL